ncbi:PLP-dependent cysteine synthase family protein [Arthrobacter rhombi]|uniref:PLP-dependent cysteine synthase family protein n=1 Tax=Arthrobacter rhombi TaxID=71253 RepID=UPI003FD105BE
MLPTLPPPAGRAWVNQAVLALEADTARSADTHLHRIGLPSHWGIELYLKDESTHRSGSLKHRLAKSLFLYGLVNGWITEGTTIVESSSGSTAVSEAYFARLLGLPFVAVVAATTSEQKIDLIRELGGTCHLIQDAAAVDAEARRLAAETGGHYMDQFTYAERATDWRGNNNIAESIFSQLELEPHPVPAWVVAGAGTGGTSATLGRYIRYHQHESRLAVGDPEGSAFLPAWTAWNDGGDPLAVTGAPSRIEGIGRPLPEPSFVPSVIDLVQTVPDGASVAAMRHLSGWAGLHAGPSTGTNMWQIWRLVAQMRAAGQQGSVVSLICDGAERYAGSHYDAAWLERAGIDTTPYEGVIEAFLADGDWVEP